MSGTISFNPYATTTQNSGFLLQTQGLVQGVASDDPTSRMLLAGGTLNSGESIPMWGGVAVNEMINVANANADGLGPSLKRSTSQTTVTGFSVFNQASSMVIVPGNTVPLAGVGNYVSFYRLGSNARIAVQCDPAIVTALNSTDEPINYEALYLGCHQLPHHPGDLRRQLRAADLDPAAQREHQQQGRVVELAQCDLDRRRCRGHPDLKGRHPCL